MALPLLGDMGDTWTGGCYVGIVLASDTSRAAICFIIDKVGLTDIFPKNLINSVVTYYCTCRHQVSADGPGWSHSCPD